jgi:hypothetical protein
MTGAETVRNGRFVLLESIGEGAQGRTFAGVDLRQPQGGERAVAIKRFEVRGATSWKEVELAEREARVLQSLSHPKLPAYIDHFEENGALYLVMEKIDGESLGAYRRRGARLAEEEVWRLLRDAAAVLDYLHGRVPPVIHRDLKPGNVIRRPDGSFAFVDFGAVRDKLRPKGGSTVVGTFGYMAPEQVQGRALPASDVYAIGATAIAMLTGREPEELPHRGLAIDVRQALRGRDPNLVRVLEKMLEPDPDRRAPRLAPLLERRENARWQPPSAEREPLREGIDRYTRRVTRRARRAARRAERAAKRLGRRRIPYSFPWPARVLFAVLLMVAAVAVSVVTQVIVPLLLRVLSLFVGRRALLAAAEATRHAGDVAVDAMRGMRQWIVQGDARASEEPPESRRRVDPHTANTPNREVGEEDDDSESSDESASRQRSWRDH